jgi:hypothetical protein
MPRIFTRSIFIYVTALTTWVQTAYAQQKKTTTKPAAKSTSAPQQKNNTGSQFDPKYKRVIVNSDSIKKAQAAAARTRYKVVYVNGDTPAKRKPVIDSSGFYSKKNPDVPGFDFKPIKLVLNKKPLTAILNHSYLHYPKTEQYRWHFDVYFEYKYKGKDGAPDVIEQRILNDLTTKLVQKLQSINLVHYAGYSDYDGYRDVLFYTDQKFKVQDAIDDFKAQYRSQRKINYRMESDPDWGNLRFYLH